SKAVVPQCRSIANTPVYLVACSYVSWLNPHVSWSYYGIRETPALVSATKAGTTSWPEQCNAHQQSGIRVCSDQQGAAAWSEVRFRVVLELLGAEKVRMGQTQALCF